MRRIVRKLAVFYLFLAWFGTLCQVDGAAEMLLLRNKFSPGLSLSYRGYGKMKISISRAAPLSDVEARFLHSVKAVSPDRDGGYTVKYGIEDLQTSVKNGEKEQLLPPRFEFLHQANYEVKYDPEGNPVSMTMPDGVSYELVNGRGGNFFINPLITLWPPDKVTIGSSWEKEFTVQLPGVIHGSVGVLEKYKLESLENFQGYRCAKIQSTYANRGRIKTGVAEQAAPLNVSVYGMGLIYFAVNEGFPVQVVYAGNIEADLPVPEKDESRHVRINLDISFMINKP